jgi:hypothetical protein
MRECTLRRALTSPHHAHVRALSSHLPHISPCVTCAVVAGQRVARRLCHLFADRSRRIPCSLERALTESVSAPDGRPRKGTTGQVHENVNDLKTEPAATLPGGATGRPDRNMAGGKLSSAHAEGGHSLGAGESRTSRGKRATSSEPMLDTSAGYFATAHMTRRHTDASTAGIRAIERW